MGIVKSNAHWFFGVAVSIFASSSCVADSFGTFDDHEKLKDQVILSVGSVSDSSFSSNASINPLAMNSQFGVKPSAHKIGQYCFLSDEPMNGNAYILLADQFGIASIAAVSTSISTIEIKIKPVTLIDCGQLQKAEQDAFTRDVRNLKRQIDLQTKQNKIMMDAIKQQQELKKMHQAPQ